MKEIILAYQGEMTLKGLNRGKFEARLAKIIRWRLEPLGKFKVYQAQSTVFIEPKEDGLDMDEAFRRVSHVFGIVKLSRAVECPKDFDAICETAEAYLGETLRGLRTFKVEAKRADKAYPMKSPEICRELGAYLLDKHHHLRVDVHNPQLEIMVEIRDHAAYVHGPKVEAAGGLPVGTSGRALNQGYPDFQGYPGRQAYRDRRDSGLPFPDCPGYRACRDFQDQDPVPARVPYKSRCT